MDEARLPAGKLPAALLAELLAAGPPQPPEVLLPPAVGEDACAIEVAAGALVAATDPVTLTGRGIGTHAVLVNANDVAVMGAAPRWFLACVLLPPGTSERAVRELFAELRAALAQVGAALVGGHTEVTDAVARPVVVGQMLGLREDGRFVRTGGLRPGDVVLQVGPAPVEGAAVLAAEAAGRLGGVAPELLARARAALVAPGISVVAPALRAAALGACAMHDPTEGGLSSGLHELAQASGLALRVDPEAVLWFEPGRAVARALGADPWGVLASGTLLAGFARHEAEAARAALEAEGWAVRAIAHAESGAGVRTREGRPLVRYEQDELSRVLCDPA
jgi:hydrogenase maturation factor